MANTISNNRISNLINSQVPFFVRNDHRTFVRFLEAYYEYLEQDTKTVNRIKNIPSYVDIDRTIDEFAEKFYDVFMKYIPNDVLVDKRFLTKHIKDFYLAKGTEKGTRFLLRALYNLEVESFYYPKKDVIRASDGKWFIQKSLRVIDTKVGGYTDETLDALSNYAGTQIRGNTSNATALVERVDRFYEQGIRIDELIISNIKGTFENGESIIALFDDTEAANTITSNIYSGVINLITVTNPGTQYEIGDPVVFVSNVGNGACALVSSVTTGNIASILVLAGGAGFRVDDFLLFSGGGGGSGANANVSLVLDDNTIHPNSYNIISSIIDLEANTPLNNAVYSNLNSVDANSWIANAVNTWSYSNTGPINQVLILNPGQDYSSAPSISAIPNSAIFGLGILGRMEIITGGTEYRIGDIIEFVNVPGGYGSGAIANVTNVDVANSNTITAVQFQQMGGHIIGGSGYDQDYLPTTNVSTSTGSGANIAVTAILGSGEEFGITTSAIGAIQTITVYDRGSGYDSNVTIDLTGSGDGLATANVSTVQGVYSYPGRFLNDDGMLSSYNFIQDRDYYQPFSYVIKTRKSVSLYEQAVRELVHPAGTKFFGEYMLTVGEGVVCNGINSTNCIYSTGFNATYVKTGNTINVNQTAHGLSVNDNVSLLFESGGTSNVRNGVYTITASSTDYFEVILKAPISYITIGAGGALYNSNNYLVFSGDGYGANASYTVNANGGIVSVTLDEPGIKYSYAPTVTANGSNSIAATFTAVLKYANNTSGNVEVIIV